MPMPAQSESSAGSPSGGEGDEHQRQGELREERQQPVDHDRGAGHGERRLLAGEAEDADRLGPERAGRNRPTKPLTKVRRRNSEKPAPSIGPTRKYQR